MRQVPEVQPEPIKADRVAQIKPKPADTSRSQPYKRYGFPDPPPRDLYSRNDLLWGYILLGFGMGFVVGLFIAAIIR